jgi:hypothetical protein
MYISNDIQYVGVNDHQVDLFEGQYPVPNGMAYNSYVILDEKIAIMDTVDVNFGGEWLLNIIKVVEKRVPDYLIIQHMEPDHSAIIADFMEIFKTTKIVSTAKAFAMMNQFFGTDFADRQIVVKEGDTWSIMTAYNLMNGDYTSEKYDLLTGILRKEWGYTGIVVTDWDDKAEHYRGIRGGNNVRMPHGSPKRLQMALKEGLLTRQDLINNVTPVLNWMMKLD